MGKWLPKIELIVEEREDRGFIGKSRCSRCLLLHESKQRIIMTASELVLNVMDPRE